MRGEFVLALAALSLLALVGVAVYRQVESLCLLAFHVVACYLCSRFFFLQDVIDFAATTAIRSHGHAHI